MSLLLPDVSLALPKRKGLALLFHHLDRVFKVWEKRGSERIRGAAIREAEHWILDRTRHTEGLGAIYPAMMYFIMALDALDYPRRPPGPGGSHPPLRIAADRNSRTASMFQPCVSPIWDTAICAFAMGEAGVRRRPPHDPRRRLAHQQRGPPQRRLVREAPRYRALRLGLRVRQRVLPRYRRHRHGAARPDARQGFQPRGPGRRASAARSTGCSPCSRRTADGRPSMSTTTGPSSTRCPSPTTTRCSTPPVPTSPAGCVECLCRRGLAQDAAVRRGVAYLLGAQEKDGSWYGRWGVNYIYGTFLAMRGLAANGAPKAGPPLRRPRSGCAPYRIPMADGANRAPATSRIASSRRPVARRRPPGRFSVWLPPVSANPRPRAAAYSSSSTARRPTAVGPKKLPPAPASPTCSTSLTGCTGIIFRYWPSQPSSWSPSPPSLEIFSFNIYDFSGTNYIIP